MSSNEPRGRPRHYDSPEELAAMVDLYVLDCQQKKTPMTSTGMCLFLGFTQRSGLSYYRDYPGFQHVVDRAHLLVENAYENRLSAAQCTGAIFALKNMGWVDKVATDHTSSDGSMRPQAVDPATVRAISAALDDEC